MTRSKLYNEFEPEFEAMEEDVQDALVAAAKAVSTARKRNKN